MAHQNTDGAAANQKAPSNEKVSTSVITAPTSNEAPANQEQQTTADVAAPTQPPPRSDSMRPPTGRGNHPAHLPAEMLIAVAEQGDVTSRHALHASPTFRVFEHRFNTWGTVREREWEARDFSYFVQREDEEEGRGRPRIPWVSNHQAPFFRRIQGERYVGDTGGSGGQQQEDRQCAQSADGDQTKGDSEDSCEGSATNN